MLLVVRRLVAHPWREKENVSVDDVFVFWHSHVQTAVELELVQSVHMGHSHLFHSY